jgi:hypothetical protein
VYEGQLVATTNGPWITKPPSRSPATSPQQRRVEENDWTVLDPITEVMTKMWKRVERIGTPDSEPIEDGDNPDSIVVEVRLDAAGPTSMACPLRGSPEEEERKHRRYRSQGDVCAVNVVCTRDKLGEVVAAIDEAIEYANDQLEAVELAAITVQLDQREAESARAKERHAELRIALRGRRNRGGFRGKEQRSRRRMNHSTNGTRTNDFRDLD